MYECIEKKLKLQNNINDSKLIDAAFDKNSADQIAQEIQVTDTTIMSDEKALALFVVCNLTKATYNLIRETALKTNTNIYPPYYKVYTNLTLILC